MKLLAFDVDDTLIAADKVFRPSTIASLNERLALGDAIAIVSGRPYVGIMKFLNALIPGQKFPIGANGAVVYDLEGHPLMVDRLKFQDYVDFYHRHEDLIKKGADIYCYTLDKVGYFSYGPFVRFEVNLNGTSLIDLNQHPLAPDAPILKFMIAWANADWSAVKLSEQERQSFHMIRSDPRFMEFTSLTCDKATGVEFLRKYLGIAKEDVYTFGDQGNDVGMIAAYQGVAMANAIPEAKKAAKYITKSVDEDGVSYALHHFVK